MANGVRNVAVDKAVQWREEVAARIAAEVRHAACINQTRLAKVTSLLNAFRSPGTPAKFNEVKKELEGRGLVLDSGWPEIHHPGVLEFSVSGRAEQQSVVEDTDDTIQMSIWSPDRVDAQERPLPKYDEPAPDDVLWFNVDPPLPDTRVPSDTEAEMRRGWRDDFRRRATAPSGGQALSLVDGHLPQDFERRVLHVLSQLQDWCPGLDEEMVRDLLRQDMQPKVDTYGDEKDGVRGVSVVAVIARETPLARRVDSDGVSEEMVFQLVEVIVGDRWIVTCWHPSRIYAGTKQDSPGDPILREPFLSHVRHRWLEGIPPAGGKTSGDLGIYLARSLVDTYGASHRMMERWVESWEVDFYKSLSSSDKADMLKEAAGEISNLLSMVGEFRRRLTAFDHARLTTADKSWFPAVSDRDETAGDHEKQSGQVSELAKSIQSAGDKLTELSDDIRADMDLLMLQSAATQQESAEQLQGYLAKVTGLVLVPTLVAGLFGANTRLPGGGTWMGFELMLVLMVVSAVGVYLVIRKLGK